MERNKGYTKKTLFLKEKVHKNGYSVMMVWGFSNSRMTKVIAKPTKNNL